MQKTQKQSGQGLLEYLILIALIALISITATKKLGTKIQTKINEARNAIDRGIPIRLGPR